MKNLPYYNGSAFDFHKDIINSKHEFLKSDPTVNYRNLISSLNPDIKVKYDEFDDKFKANQLQYLNPFGFTGNSKDNLLKLYSYKSSIIKRLKVMLTTDNQGRVFSTCQNCTISEVNSFDHFIPKEEFPEFVVNPKNLFPSCTKCNSLKSKAWRRNNKRIFLNLYLDELPIEQYLFVDVSITKDEVDFSYLIDYQNNIELGLFELIKSHYKELNLTQRFKENSDAVVSELDSSIISSLNHMLSINEIQSIILEDCTRQKSFFGYNYWKVILKESLIKNKDFLIRYQ